MKQFILAVLLTFGTGIAMAQNTFTVTNETKDVVIGKVEVTFSNHSTQTYEIGGPGVYDFKIGKLEVISMTIGGTTCKVGETVQVELKRNGSIVQLLTRLLESVQDESKGFSSLIR